MKLSRLFATAGVGTVLLELGPGVATADPGDTAGASAQTVVVSGHTLGPKDGLKVDYASFEIVPGGGTVGATYPTTAAPGTVVPMTVWGSSYAYSREILQLGYVGYGKAAANVYNGQRIVEVCFWWTRSGVSLTPKTCSDANFNGGWVQGPEKTYSVSDTLNPVAPPTYFNISTVRIDPTAHW